MAELIFSTKGAAEAIAAQEALNKAAEEGAKAYDELGEAAQDAGDEAAKSAKDREDAEDKVQKKQKKTREEVAAISREQQQAGRLAEQITKRNETAQERYNRLIGDARKAFTQAELSVTSYNREIQTLNQELATSSGRFAAFGTKQEATFSTTAIAAVTQYAAAMISVGAATKLITDEMERQQQLRDSVAGAKASVSETRNVVIRNLGGASDATVQQVLQQNQQLASAINISERYVNLARADALSATGGDLAASLSAVSVASQYLRDKPENISLFTGALTDLAKATGTNDAMVNLGFLSTIASQSRVVDPGQQAANIPRSVIGQLSFGATPQEAAALFSALTSGSADFSGATSGTSAIALAEQLSRFEGAGPGTLGQRIRALQQNPDAAQAFLADASFEKISLGPIRQLLLDPNSAISKQFAANLGGLPNQTGLAAEGARALERLGVNPLNVSVDRTRALEAAAERGLTGTPTAELTTAEIENLRSVINTSGGRPWETAAFFRLRQFGGFSVNEAIDEVQSQRAINRAELPAGAERDRFDANLDAMLKVLEDIKNNTAKLEEGGFVGVAE